MVGVHIVIMSCVAEGLDHHVMASLLGIRAA